ncbi:hypothetical protein BDQ17DRAFT_1102774 [Cyathus striatus]|nr:hypothetical protein BDQ17DRAFT_1102774 [Cyathus striatus]
MCDPCFQSILVSVQHRLTFLNQLLFLVLPSSSSSMGLYLIQRSYIYDTRRIGGTFSISFVMLLQTRHFDSQSLNEPGDVNTIT